MRGFCCVQGSKDTSRPPVPGVVRPQCLRCVLLELWEKGCPPACPGACLTGEGHRGWDGAGIVAHDFSSQEAEAGGSLSLRPVLSTERVVGEPG